MISPSLTSFSKSAFSVVYPKHVYLPSNMFFPAGVRSESKSNQKNCVDAELASYSDLAIPNAPKAWNGKTDAKAPLPSSSEVKPYNKSSSFLNAISSGIIRSSFDPNDTKYKI